MQKQIKEVMPFFFYYTKNSKFLKTQGGKLCETFDKKCTFFEKKENLYEVNWNRIFG